MKILPCQQENLLLAQLPQQARYLIMYPDQARGVSMMTSCQLPSDGIRREQQLH